MNKKSLVFLDSTMKDGLTSVPNSVLTSRTLSLEAKALFSIFLMLTWRKYQITESFLAEITGCDIQKIRECVSELQNHRLIREAV
ncbi:hypothetical protein L9W92_18465 [Pelotomaculum terephthalicicum JT]|uniref:hypothetical protein n=1 Tax=Pelotomaculum terephthalicicum TaxID=206393 RepID=UPI0009D2C2DF|nr:hypothetical protein [Pelotomaculum terephthalicicum]MCG9969977.1 hypothetical protein [Pelotomaculum terephthalicicum JT]OPX90357.1 MAG: hypothetical protein A4E53_01040 [Pelotomaculum sp. PtaB.Bin104]OPY58156.1 MAG: hypothetical protein A4E56_03428 [Pelotomaculum sp. PtaU1.Bin065]